MENNDEKKSNDVANSKDMGLARREALKRIAQKIGIVAASAVVLEACGKGWPGYSDYTPYSNYSDTYYYYYTYTNYTVTYSNYVYTNYTVYST